MTAGKRLLKRPSAERSARGEATARTAAKPLSLCSLLLPSSPDLLRSTQPKSLPIAAAPLRAHRTTGVTGKEEEMEVEMLEDDLFFAELSKRISLLITDDDDADFAAAAQFIPAAAAPLPGFGHHHVPQQRGASMLAPPAYTLFHHAASYGAGGDSTASRAWQQHQQQQQCGSKGTGVFIPRSTPGAGHHKKKGKNRGAAAGKARAAQAAGTNALTSGAPTTKKRA